MSIIDLDLLPDSGAASFTRLAPRQRLDIPASAYSAWGGHAVAPDKVRRRLSVPMPDIGVFEFNNVRANMYGLAAEDDRTFISSRQFGPGFGAERGGFDQPALGTAVAFDCVTPLYRPGDHIYGHWLLDILPRAWLVHTLCPDREVTYLIRQGSPPFGRIMLEALGLPAERIVEIDTRIAHPRASEMLVATNMRYNQVVHPAIRHISDALTDRFGAEGADMTADALFVSRRAWIAKKANKRQLVNSNEVEAYYGTEGFRAVSPESLSFGAQVALFRSASAMAGSEGSGLHNSLFAPPGITVDALIGPNNASLIQAALCIACGQQINMICGQSSDPDDTSREADFAVPMTTLSARFHSERTSI